MISRFWHYTLKAYAPTKFSLALIFLLVEAHTGARAESMQSYAAACDAAIGAAATVRAFQCDQGTLVPDNHPTGSGMQGSCDEPNRLNKECDPGSRFQVLVRSDDAYVVAHCRKKGNTSGGYGDIAVIQYNRKNGATCFYQALGSNLPQSVPAPSGGEQGFWRSPHVAAVSDQCGSCHDNGPFIRSPYLNQVHGINPISHLDDRLPGSDNLTFNNDTQAYAFVGEDFKTWKTYKVEVAGNQCLNCHMLGVNNVAGGGTARDFALRATSQAVALSAAHLPMFQSETNKNPLSAASPSWMPPSPPYPAQTSFNLQAAKDARAIFDCAMQFNPNAPLPNTDACRITLHASAFTGPTASGGGTQTALAAILNYVNEPGTGTVIPQSPSSGVPTGPTGPQPLPAIIQYILN